MGEVPEISLTEHQRYWLEHVRACESSGKRITEYAADHGLAVRAMYDGKRALVKKGVLPRTHATRFQRARVVTLPARVLDSGNRDGVPNVLLEAMACDRPVVTSRFRGLPDVLPYNASGLAYFSDYQNLVSGLEAVKCRPGNRESIIDYSWDHISAILLDTISR